MLAIAIHKPLINSEYTIITIPAKINSLDDNNKLISLYILNLLPAIPSDISASIKLSIPVIIDDIDTLKNLPIIMSLLLIGKVNNVSSVPLSFSPAVASVAGYVALIVIAIIMNKKV